MFKRIYCRMFGHQFRRPLKGEALGVKTCRRCGTTRPIRVRARKLRQVA